MLFVSKEGAAITAPKAAFSLVNATEKAAVIATAFRKNLLCFITNFLDFPHYNICMTNCLCIYLSAVCPLSLQYILFPSFVITHYCKMYHIFTKTIFSSYHFLWNFTPPHCTDIRRFPAPRPIRQICSPLSDNCRPDQHGFIIPAKALHIRKRSAAAFSPSKTSCVAFASIIV